VRTWLPVNPNYAQGINVCDQQDDPESLLNFYRQLLAVRRETPALKEGEYQELPNGSQEIFAFLRTARTQRCAVILNYSDQAIQFPINFESGHGKLIFSSEARERIVDLDNLEVLPYEVLIVEVVE
jgi:glycosidase